ncbi:MAG: hypothetical protein HY042_01950 [Spirochaetia bacterium]|nr:hypothetical protein [Spirochaetia bacterium]
MKCEDGWGATCYFDSRKFNALKPGGFDLPPETRAACFGIHASSSCRPCYNRYELRKANELTEVSCREFWDAVDTLNTECEGCVQKVGSGCC